MDKLSQAESVGPDSRAFRREVQAIWSRPTAPGLAPTSLQPVRSGSFLDLRVRHTALEPLLFGTELPCIVGHRLSQQGLESGLVYLVSLVDVYRPPPGPVQSGVEEIRPADLFPQECGRQTLVDHSWTLDGTIFEKSMGDLLDYQGPWLVNCGPLGGGTQVNCAGTGRGARQ